MKKELAERIRSKRAGKGLKQEDIAEQLGIAIGTYSNIERGKTDITVSRLYEIADILNENVYDFLPANKVFPNVQEPRPTHTNQNLLDQFRDDIIKIVREEVAKSTAQYPSLNKKNKKK